MDDEQESQPRRGRKPIAEPANVKVQVCLTRAQHEALKDEAGLVPLGAFIRRRALEATGIPSRSREAKAG